jgi:glycosyltransferase involved in cell wall biosynthesis
VKKRLSICIPTLNRLGYLKSCLESVMSQVDDEVEVCVFNNFSDDETAEFLKIFSKLHRGFRYQNSLQRLDIDSSMRAALSMGEGEYLMLLGDDDAMLEGAVLAIKEQLNENYDLIIANGFHTDPALKPLHQHLPPNLQDSVFTNLETAFTILWDKMPFGAFLAKQECFKEKTYNKYIGTSHAYCGVVWECLHNSGPIRIKCMKEDVVYLRGAKKTWAQNEATIYLVGIPKWFRLLSYCSKIRKVVFLAQKDFFNQHAKTQYFRALRENGQLKDIKFLMSELPLSLKIKVYLVFNNLI